MTNLQPRALAALVLLLTAVWLLTGCALHVESVDASLFRRPTREAQQRADLVGVARLLLQSGASPSGVLDYLQQRGLSLEDAKATVLVALADCGTCAAKAIDGGPR